MVLSEQIQVWLTHLVRDLVRDVITRGYEHENFDPILNSLQLFKVCEHCDPTKLANLTVHILLKRAVSLAHPVAWSEFVLFRKRGNQPHLIYLESK